MSTENAKVIEKISKLLALGESPNEEEAASAVEKAQALLLKNGLTMEEVDAVMRPGKLRGEESEHGIIEQWENALGGGIARSLGGEAIVRGARHPEGLPLWLGVMVFYGPGETPKGMRKMYDYLRERIRMTATLEGVAPPDFLTAMLIQLEGGDVTEQLMSGVRLGMTARVCERLAEQADRITAAESYAGTTLVVAREAIKRKLREDNPDLIDDEKLEASVGESIGVARGRALGEDIPLNPGLTGSDA